MDLASAWMAPRSHAGFCFGRMQDSLRCALHDVSTLRTFDTTLLQLDLMAEYITATVKPHLLLQFALPRTVQFCAWQ